jgi:hypothetical protein
MSFFSTKTENRKVKHVPSVGVGTVGGRGYKERGPEGEHVVNILYTCM